MIYDGRHDLLMRGHRLARFDTETDAEVNHHDGLLGVLAAMAQPALHGIVFEQVPPSEASANRYELHAYRDGDLISTRARNLGDWYDVHAVVGPEQGLLRAFKERVLKAAPYFNSSALSRSYSVAR
jgi:hypothetical protein